MFILPHETVIAESQIIPRDIIDPLRPHICGGHAELRRYGDSVEKPLCLLGTYGPDADANYAWPSKTAGALVDLGYVKVYLDDAHLRYFQDLAGSGDLFGAVPGYSNRLKITAAESGNGFRANGADYPRFSSLLDRDVRPGDIVRLRGTDGVDTSELWSYVQDLLADVIPAVVAPATADAVNPADQAASKTPSQTAGALNHATLLAADVDVAAYDGLPSGDINETYTIRVIQASSGGDATTARLQVTTASGRDDVASVTPAAFAAPTTIGTRGLKCQFTIDGARPVDGGQAPDDFIVGQTWRVVIGQLYTAVVPTGGGTYTGTQDTTYKIEVTRGGLFVTTQVVPPPGPNPQPTFTATGSPITAGTYYFKVTYAATVGETDQPNAAKPLILPGGNATVTVPNPASVTGATGYKIYVGNSASGPFYLQGGVRTLGSSTTLSALTLSGTQIPVANTTTFTGPNPSGPQLTVSASVDSGTHNVAAADTAVSVGTLGLTFKTQAGVLGMRKGDFFYIDVTGVTGGAVQTIVLGHNLDDVLKAADDLDVELFIRKNIQVARDRVESPPDVNWSADQTYLTLKAGVTAYDTSWTSDGIQAPLPVTKGTAYVEYRSWLSTYAGKTAQVETASPAVLQAVFGPLHPDNPLGWGVHRAAQLCAPYAVKFTAMADPDDLDEWALVLQMLAGQEDTYHLVPLTYAKDVHDMYVAHVDAQSLDVRGMWRCCWLPSRAATYQILVDENSTVEADGTRQGKLAKAVLTDDPEATGTQYTMLECTTANAKFVTQGVGRGDIVRYLFSVDGFGNKVYAEFVVNTVVNEDTLLLEVGHGTAVNTAQRFEVWRTLAKNTVADVLVGQADARLNSRVRYVWPDAIDGGGLTQEGYFVCCAAAGLAARVAPHQGLAFVELAGFDAVPRSTSFFNSGQLNRLKDGGLFVVSQAPSGEVYTFSAQTTDPATVDTREEMCVRDLDAIRIHLRNRVARYFGSGNLTDSLVAKIRADLNAGVQYLRSSTFIDHLGSMIESAQIIDLRPHATEADRLVVIMAVTGPKPLNQVTVVIVV